MKSLAEAITEYCRLVVNLIWVLCVLVVGPNAHVCVGTAVERGGAFTTVIRLVAEYFCKQKFESRP